jgi:hypothetical protein
MGHRFLHNPFLERVTGVIKKAILIVSYVGDFGGRDVCGASEMGL